MNRTSLLSALAALLFALFMSPAAHASTNNCTSAQLPMTLASTANAPSSLAAGTAVNGSDISVSATINCSSSWSTGNGTLCSGSPDWSIAPGTSEPIATSVADVYRDASMPSGWGYKIFNGGGQLLRLDNYGRHDTGVPIVTGNQNIAFRVKLVKLDDTATAGSFSIGFRISCTSNEWANKTDSSSRVTMSVTSRVFAQACTLSNTSIQVGLPTVSGTAFSGTGSMAGRTASSIGLQCDPGVNAKLNFTDASKPSNSGADLALAQDSTATGVGVRLTANGDTVKFSPFEQFSQGGTEIALSNGGSSAQSVQIPLTAAYVQTAPTVVPGTVRSLVFVNIAYN